MVTTTKASATIAGNSVETVEEKLQVVEKVESDNKNGEPEQRNLIMLKLKLMKLAKIMEKQCLCVK